MKEKIKNGVKTAFAKYGLKPESVTKLVNIVETKIAAMGTIEDDKLDGVISSEIQNLEPFLGVMQSEIDSRVRKPAVNSIPNPLVEEPTDLQAMLAKAFEPYQNEVKALREKLENQDKEKARNSRLAAIKEGLKVKGATKEPVLNVVLPSAEFADSDSNEQIVEKLLPIYDAKMKEFYSDGFVPRVPDTGKSEILKAAQTHTSKVIEGAVAGLGILAPEKN